MCMERSCAYGAHADFMIRSQGQIVPWINFPSRREAREGYPQLAIATPRMKGK